MSAANPCGKRGLQVTVAAFRKLWTDPALTLDDIGARLGIAPSAVSARAKRRGLPSRRGFRVLHGARGTDNAEVQP